jgi:hypothetical protein
MPACEIGSRARPAAEARCQVQCCIELRGMRGFWLIVRMNLQCLSARDFVIGGLTLRRTCSSELIDGR